MSDCGHSHPPAPVSYREEAEDCLRLASISKHPEHGIRLALTGIGYALLAGAEDHPERKEG